MPGKLLVIATPIGNLSDASTRMVEALRACERVYCEDTRHTLKLLRHFGIEVPLESLHEHNESARIESALADVERGHTIGIVSDAGTPLLSDPGFPLVREARRRGIPVEPIPGPFAAAAALSASGIPPHPFAFWGFPPSKHGERVEFYRRVAAAGMTALVYEAPHRIHDSLEDARAVLGDVDATLARELTKMHEQILHGTISEILEAIADRESIRGEITLVFAAPAPAEKALPSPEQLRAELDRLRGEGMRRNDALKALAETYGVGKNELYRLLVDS